MSDQDPDDLDEIDRAYVDSLTPDDRLYTGHISIIAFLDRETGDRDFRVWNQMNEPLSGVIGHLEMAKLHMMARVEGAAYFGLTPYEG